MSNAEIISMFIGGAMPLLISFLKQLSWPKWANLLIAAASCAAAGAMTAWITGQLSAANIIGSMGAAFIAAEALYIAYWKNSGIDTKLSGMFNLAKNP